MGESAPRAGERYGGGRIGHADRTAPVPSGRRGRQRGTAIVELALILPFLTTLVFGSIDLGRMAKVQNRMSNAAREAAAVIQLFPTSVDSGCRDTRNATDRAAADSGIDSQTGYRLTVALKRSDGTLLPYTGCSDAVDADGTEVTIVPGDHLVVTVEADVKILGPYRWGTGDSAHLKRSNEVVVQG